VSGPDLPEGGGAVEAAVWLFFERYQRTFERALAGDADMDEVARMYAAEFIAASSHGVRAGRT